MQCHRLISSVTLLTTSAATQDSDAKTPFFQGSEVALQRLSGQRKHSPMGHKSPTQRAFLLLPLLVALLTSLQHPCLVLLLALSPPRLVRVCVCGRVCVCVCESWRVFVLAAVRRCVGSECLATPYGLLSGLKEVAKPSKRKGETPSVKESRRCEALRRRSSTNKGEALWSTSKQFSTDGDPLCDVV